MPATKCGFDDIAGGASGSVQLEVYGPTLRVDVGFDTGYRGPPSVPLPGLKGLHALVDTGAAECCIDGMLAAHLNLPKVDRRPVAGVHGSRMVDIVIAQVHVPTLAFTMYGQFAAVDLAGGGQPHLVLIGRTFLSALTMGYGGRTGTVTLSR